MHRKIRIFVASPSDVTRERICLRKIVEVLNRRIANSLGYVLELKDWLEVPPGAGRAESVILRALPMESFDIFIGILWQRFGSPTGNVDPRTGRRFLSGTEEEFKWAYNNWKKRGRPEIMIYRRTSSPANVNTLQYSRVCSFFKEFDAAGGEHPALYQPFRNMTDFAIMALDHLEGVLLKWGKTYPATAPAKQIVEPKGADRRSLATQVPSHFFQVLMPKFKLSQKQGKQTLHLEVHDDLEPIEDRCQREEFRKRLVHLRSAQKKLERDLHYFTKRQGTGEAHIRCPNWPLRYGNGGVLPVVSIESKKYVCLFYREVFPVGWNIANGSSDNYQELLYPERVMFREFGEELLIADERDQAFRCFNPGKDILYPGYQSAARIAWDKALPELSYRNYGCLSLSVDWVRGPDSISVSVGNARHVTSGLFLNITPEDNAIEVDRVAYVRLPKGASVLDGEVTENKPVGRIVGLFEFSGFAKRLKNEKFIPDRFFFQGQEYTNGELFNAARNKFIELRHENPAENRRVAGENKGEPDLCPITRSLTRTYFQCLKAGLVQEPGGWRDKHNS